VSLGVIYYLFEGEVNQVEEKVLLARGGDGGMAANQYVGQKGDALSVTLDLKVISDVGFVGYYRNKNCLFYVLAYSQCNHT